MTKQTHEEKLAKKRLWNKANAEKVKEYARRSRAKHKERRALDTKKWVERNKEYSKQYHKQYHKEWYQDNKEKRDAQNIQWAKDNPESVKKIKDNFKQNNPEITAHYLKKYGATLRGKYRTMKGGAFKRNYVVEISFEQFCKLVEKPCNYCGESEKRIGVDRIDNTKGYTLKNSAPCCTICNMMKKTMTVKEFTEHISRINNHLLEI